VTSWSLPAFPGVKNGPTVPNRCCKTAGRLVHFYISQFHSSRQVCFRLAALMQMMQNSNAAFHARKCGSPVRALTQGDPLFAVCIPPPHDSPVVNPKVHRYPSGPGEDRRTWTGWPRLSKDRAWRCVRLIEQMGRSFPRAIPGCRSLPRNMRTRRSIVGGNTASAHCIRQYSPSKAVEIAYSLE
jgi:hypothetical protein